MKNRGLMIYYTILISIGAIVISLLVYSNYYHEIERDISYENGVYNLTGVDFEKGDKAYLNGKWEFYHDTLLVQDKVEEKDEDKMLVDVPSSWSEYDMAEGKLDGGGYASYRTYIKPNNNGKVVFSVKDLGGAYNIYVNRALVSNSGVISKNPNDVISSNKIEVQEFDVNKEETYEIIIEVSSKKFAGLYMTPTIEGVESYTKSVRINNIIDIMLVGIILFLIFVSCVLYLIIGREGYTKYPGILFGAILFRIISTGSTFAIFGSLLITSNYEDANVVMYLATFIAKISLMIFVKRVLDLNISRSRIKSFIIYFSILYGIFLFTPQGIYNKYFEVLVPALSYVMDIYVIYKLKEVLGARKRNGAIMLIAFILFEVGITLDGLYISGKFIFETSTYMALNTIAFSFIIIFIYGKQIAMVNRQAIELVQLREEVTKKEVAIMLSQIKPHFIYNTLNTIAYLCVIDGERAEELVIDFSKYLRVNLEITEGNKIIPFSKELEHIKIYGNIEKERFGDKLKIIYEIEVDSFIVPILSIQPLVENAIKHGVTKKIEGGTVVIRSVENDENYMVSIIDDGVGFNINNIKENSTGLKNITTRLKILVDAEVKIVGEKNVGTRVDIIIPKI